MTMVKALHTLDLTVFGKNKAQTIIQNHKPV